MFIHRLSQQSSTLRAGGLPFADFSNLPIASYD
jgi:hypothetical protein